MRFINVSGQWKINQKNGFVVDVNVKQIEDQLDAFCSHSNGRVRSTEAKGFVRNEDFDLTVTWDNNTKGHYTARLERGHFTTVDQGILRGVTKDLMNPSSSASWESDRTFTRL